MFLNSLNGKPVTIWGQGREGLAVQAFIKKHYPACQIKAVEDPLQEPLSGIVIKSPGVSLYRPEIKDSQAVFTSGTNLFLEMCYRSEKRPYLIGVTGTKGKSTTSSLIAHLLREQGRRVALGGNIGFPLIQFAEGLENYDVVVAEISSYQAADLEYSFDINIVLNLYPEHIDWHQSHERYYQDKLNILRHRQPGQKAVLNAQDERTGKYVEDLTDAVYFNDESGVHEKDGFFWDGQKRLFETSVVPLPGTHNLKNVCAAITAVKLTGGDAAACKEGLLSFEALPHRLQLIAVKDGVRFINDSISTTPETAIAALQAFAPARIYLIAGGYDRQQDYHELAEYIAEGGAEAVITLPETGARLAKNVREAGGIAYETADMAAAVQRAYALAIDGDIVLLSPASPSYGRYKSFEERGAVFMQHVQAL